MNTLLRTGILFLPVLSLLLVTADSSAKESSPFVPQITVEALAEGRVISTDNTLSWLEGGLGKTRYGSGEKETLFRGTPALLLLKLQFPGNFSLETEIQWDTEPRDALLGGRLDAIQGFARYFHEFSSGWEWESKAGLFFPPLSFEHSGRGWSTTHTLTPSAIGSWIGEEVRTLGFETSISHRTGENDFSLWASVFEGNDPTGSLLAYRGWALHDRLTGFTDKLPLPALPVFEKTGGISAQAPYVKPFVEIDDKAGWALGGKWNPTDRTLFEYSYYDNNADPKAFDGAQYAWHTRFHHAGLKFFLPGEWELWSQFLTGKTEMGFKPGLGAVVYAEFQSHYFLLTKKWDKQRVSARFEHFHVNDEDAFPSENNSNESGHAWTVAYLLKTGENHRLVLEWMRVESARPERLNLLSPEKAQETVIQAGFRWQWG